ncbi:hypothetical protein Tco_0439930 [Tanacetum coccineum]
MDRNKDRPIPVANQYKVFSNVLATKNGANIYHETSRSRWDKQVAKLFLFAPQPTYVHTANPPSVVDYYDEYQADDHAMNVPSYDAKAVSQVHASSKVHEQVSHGKRKTVIQIMDDDQTDSNIIFDDLFVENNVRKEDFKEQEDRYLDDILDLDEKVSSHDRTGLGYTNPELLKKAIAAQPKMYDGDLIHSNKLVIHSTDSEETLEDVVEKLSAEQTYFSIPFTSDNGSKSKDVSSESPVSYDELSDSLVQFEPHVLASRAKKPAKNHDPLALIAHSNDSSSHSHANSSYSPQPYYVTHPPSVVDYNDEYQGENQAVVQDGRVDIQTKNACCGGNANKNARRNRTQGFNTGNAVMKAIRLFSMFYELSLLQAKQMFSVTIAMGKVIMLVSVRNQKFVMQVFQRNKCCLDMKMKAGCNQHIEENDFMLNTSYGEDLEELTTADMLMARLQLADDHARNVPSYDAKAVSQVHASSKVQEQVSHGKRKTVIQITDDDQIDSNIIFDDPFVENNGGTSEHDSIAHDEYHE